MPRVVFASTSSYGKSTVFFFEPSYTSTVGRGAGGGALTFTGAGLLDSLAGRGAERRIEDAAGLAVELLPGSGAIMARSPVSKVRLLAPAVCSSAWSTELRITSWSLPSREAGASF